MMSCPNNNTHKHFITTTLVCQDWLVDSSGNFIEVAEDCTEVFKGPDTGNEWACADCGAEAVEDKR